MFFGAGFGILYVVFMIALAALAVWVLFLLGSYLRLKNAELRDIAARRQSE
jgi:hypothetical protein